MHSRCGNKPSIKNHMKLILFDVDGTLVDSQAMIAASLTAAFRAEGLPVPERARGSTGSGSPPRRPPTSARPWWR